ncbi:MAG: DUF934 domain-containing protein [Hyphomicrobiales bacterium]|nr:DUF934 domain-containing protein [Hyphomicrobiales bacterium]
MPLIKDGRFTTDDWQRLAEPDEPPSVPARLIMGQGDFSARGMSLVDAGHEIGLEIANNADPEELAIHFPVLKLIAVPFPKSADGRGFSIATRLRRLGFPGELRAVGYLIADQYALARSCGFDTVDIPEALAERQPEQHWLEAQRIMTFAYQRGYGEMQNIVTARWGNSA